MWGGDSISSTQLDDDIGNDPAVLTATPEMVQGQVGMAISLNGLVSASVSDTGTFQFTDQITVAGWVKSNVSHRFTSKQTILAKWAPKTSFSTFGAYDASGTEGQDNRGFIGVGFDGRYAYFIPSVQSPDEERFLRYDTQKPFTDASSWQSYDSGTVGGLTTGGYTGSVFDGRYLYFVPFRKGAATYHGRVLRLDTTADFKESSAWANYDAGATDGLTTKGFYGGIYDGRYVYFIPNDDGTVARTGRFLRYDTQGDFSMESSWDAYDAGSTDGLATKGYAGGAFDGRYLYFAPFYSSSAFHGRILRYDTQGSFTSNGAWSAYDASSTDSLLAVGYSAATFDGRYVYFVPSTMATDVHGVVLRFDTHGDFASSQSWAAYDAGATDSLETRGYSGGLFDGRYVNFIPRVNFGNFGHGRFLRYDTTQDFKVSTSWKGTDASTTDGLSTIGMVGGASDGRYLYFAPRHETLLAHHGRVLRYDTLGSDATFALEYTGIESESGFSSAAPGAQFRVNTSNGLLSATHHRSLSEGWHFLVGTYDGTIVRLYVDGELVATREGTGLLVNNSVPITIGNIKDGASILNGALDEIMIFNQVVSAKDVSRIHQAGPLGVCKEKRIEAFPMLTILFELGKRIWLYFF